MSKSKVNHSKPSSSLDVHENLNSRIDLMNSRIDLKVSSTTFWTVGSAFGSTSLIILVAIFSYSFYKIDYNREEIAKLDKEFENRLTKIETQLLERENKKN